MSTAQRWTPEGLLDAMQPEDARVAEPILVWADILGRLALQKEQGKTWTGAEVAVSPPTGKIKLFKIAVNGSIQIYPGVSGWFLTCAPFDDLDLRGRFQERISAVTGHRWTESDLSNKGRKIDLKDLAQDHGYQEFLLMFKWVAATILDYEGRGVSGAG